MALVNQDPSDAEGAVPTDGQPKVKGLKLKSYDLMLHQILNSIGANGIETIPLDKVATVMSKGNKAAGYLSELCDESPAWKGIAISRLAEVQLVQEEQQ